MQPLTVPGLRVGLSLWSTQEPVFQPQCLECVPVTALGNTAGAHCSVLPHTKVWYFIKVFMGIVSWAKQQLPLCPLQAAPLFSALHFTSQETKPGKTQPSSKPVDQQYLDRARDPHCRMPSLCCPSSSSFSLLENPTAMKRKSFVCQGPCLHVTSIPGKNYDIWFFLNLILIMLFICILISKWKNKSHYQVREFKTLVKEGKIPNFHVSIKSLNCLQLILL